LSQKTSYASLLALIGAERGKLLGEARIKSLAETKNLIDFTAQLHDSAYQDKIAKIPSPLNSRKLERAFHESLLETEIKILKKTPRTSAKYLLLFIEKFEVENLKTLIKSTTAKLTPDQRAEKIYFSAQNYLKNRGALEEAAKASDLKQLVATLKASQFASALRLGLESFEESGSTTCLDVLLDKAFYEKLYDAYCALPRKEKPHAQFYAGMDNDGYVLFTLLRAKNLLYDPNWLRLAVPSRTFEISKERVEEMVTAQDFEAAFAIAQKTSYKSFLQKAQTPEATVATAEHNFKTQVLHHAKDSRSSEIFNIGMPLAFLVQKEVEVHNLSAVALGVEAGLKSMDILAHVTF
jgi:V/A-type H+/Na+-transporting ATPase subunit C